jgi:hypothetical protein
MTRPALLVPGVAAILVLAACTDRREPAEDEQAGPTVLSEEAAASASSPSTEPGPREAQAGIPAALQGRWGLAPGGCSKQSAGAEGLLEVSADKLEFYESVAQLEEVKERDATAIRATFAFSGEGEQWTRDMALTARNDGRTLIRRDYGPDAMPEPIEYQRCR